jgi:hypothetical protein
MTQFAENAELEKDGNRRRKQQPPRNGCINVIGVDLNLRIGNIEPKTRNKP